MKREIKFRAWDKEHGIMYSDVEIDSDYCKDEDGDHVENNYWSNYDHELMQYTGIKDKNGKEIYEGDLIKIWDSDTKGSYEMAYDQDRACFTLRQKAKGGMSDRGRMDGYTYYSIIWQHQKIFKVIGNIYENHKLLKDK